MMKLVGRRGHGKRLYPLPSETNMATNPCGPKEKAKRARRGYFCDQTNEWVDDNPLESSWWKLYCTSDRFGRTKKDQKSFRHRFRMPFREYKRFLDLAVAENWFPGVGKPDAAGKLGALLGAFRYLGRGWTFDDLQEATLISQERHRKFFHDFILVGSTVMFKKWVRQPVSPDEVRDCKAEFEEAGYPGAFYSTDATHIICEKISARLKINHSGGKAAQTTRVFNISVNHRRRILATSDGCPGRWNDKSVLRFDRFLCDIRSGKLYSNEVFSLYDAEGVLHEYRGGWGLSDNGYLKWSSLMPPLKESSNYADIRWSKWLESMRKDVECTFGIMKGRWRILKTGIRIQGLDNIDHIWKTCCALHNWLLEVDGLDARWNQGVPSLYAGTDGLHDAADVQRILALAPTLTPDNAREYDQSGMGSGDAPEYTSDADEDEDDDPPVAAIPQDLRNIPHINSIPFETFRRLLIVHFEYLWSKRQIKWPSRNGVGRPYGWDHGMVVE
jgi:hypothetical protein